jgi:hypothetical protein
MILPAIHSSAAAASAPKHHADFLAASDEFPKWAESLCI